MAVTARKRSQGGFLVADCDSADAVGDMVRISADEVLGIYQVGKLNILSNDYDLPLGMIIAKPEATKCVVQRDGEVRGVYSGLTPGKQLFINSASRLTHSVPTHPAVGVSWVHPAAQALSSEAVLLRVQLPVKLNA
jgi:hypothetical protein